MPINLGGNNYDLTPLTRTFGADPANNDFAAETSRFQIFFWSCSPPEPAGRMRVRLNQNSELTIVNQVEFHETNGAILSPIDSNKTTEMKLKVFGDLSVSSMSEMVDAVNRIFGKQRIKIDLSPFEWMKPFASYAVWINIRYLYFEVRNRTLGHRFFIGIPHSVQLTADVVKLCNAAGMKEAMAGGKKNEAADLGLTFGGKPSNRKERRNFLSADSLRLMTFFSPIGGEIPDWIREESEKIEREIEKLNEMDGN